MAKKNVVIFAAISALILGQASAALRTLEVQGHRGARGLRPENTLSAFEYALQLGVDVLELDLGVSKDGQVVIYHDQWVNPALCKGANRVPLNSLTLSELKRLDCGSLKNPRFPEQQPQPLERIPSLDEFFSWIQSHPSSSAKKLGFNIEIKSDPEFPALSPPPDVFAKRVIEVVRQHGMQKRTVLQSFDHRTLIEARRLEPELTLSALVEKRPTGSAGASLSQIAIRAGAQILSPAHQWLTAEDVKELHASGIRVIPWTANTESEFEKLLILGVDGIITDYPDRLLAFLKTRKKR